MFNFKEKDKLIRKERRFLSKINFSKWYYSIILPILLSFSPMKKFLVLSGRGIKKTIGIISFSIFKVLGLKIGYLDDFIVNKNVRGKGIGARIFNQSLDKLEKNDCDYVALVSNNERKASHSLYKKFGLTIISLGVGIVAYKKLKAKNNKEI